MRFAPPSSAPVDAAAFAGSLERALSPALGPNSTLAQAPFLGDVVGARAYQAGRASRVSGIRAVGDVLSIRLRRPAGDLPARLAMPIVLRGPARHPGDPRRNRDAGPDGRPLLRGRRRPRPSCSCAATPAIAGRGGAPARHRARDERRARRRGRGRVARPGRLRRERQHPQPLAAVRARRPLADPRTAARRGARLFTGRTLGIQFLDLNTRRGLFRAPRLRTAVNLAVDRRALARAIGAAPAGAYLPPGVPGASAGGFPLTPVLSRARALAGRGGRAVVLTRELSSCPQCGAALALLRAQLARIGVTLVVKQTTEPGLDVLRHPRIRWDMALDNWLFDYPDASDIVPLLERRVAGSQESRDSTIRS